MGCRKAGRLEWSPPGRSARGRCAAAMGPGKRRKERVERSPRDERFSGVE